MTTLSVKKYLDRIHYTGNPQPDLQTLKAIHRAHLTSVPYENLDLLYRRPCPLDVESLFDKIVNHHRGGYCFELNGLFHWLLNELGFHVTQYFARWLFGEIPFPMRRHRMMKVVLPEGDFIADVGVGCICPLSPLAFKLDVVQEREGNAYRMIQEPRFGNLIQIKSGSEWKNFYSFTEDPHWDLDFEYVHYFCANHPASVFNQEAKVHLFTEFGRSSVADIPGPDGGKVRTFKIGNEDGSVNQFPVSTDAEFFSALKKYFNLTFSE